MRTLKFTSSKKKKKQIERKKEKKERKEGEERTLCQYGIRIIHIVGRIYGRRHPVS